MHLCCTSMDFPGGSDSEDSACHAGGLGSIPGLGRSPGEGNGNPLQYSCLENPMDGGTCRPTVHGVAKSWTWRRFHSQVVLDMFIFNHHRNPLKQYHLHFTSQKTVGQLNMFPRLTQLIIWDFNPCLEDSSSLNYTSLQGRELETYRDLKETEKAALPWMFLPSGFKEDTRTLNDLK